MLQDTLIFFANGVNLTLKEVFIKMTWAMI